MRTYKHIICILTAIVLLIACSEAELEKLPYGTVSINATWSGDHPIYEVKIDEDAPLEVKDISIFEEFTDNNFPDYYSGHKKNRWIKVNTTEAPYIVDDKCWTAYGNDLFEAYAKVITSTGSFISEKVSITYPTDNIIRIKNVKYSRYSDYSSMILEGENFDLRATYKIGDTPIEHVSGTPNGITIYNYLAPKSGLINETLVVNGKKYPFTFDYPVARIDSISKKEIEIGDTLVVYLKDCEKYANYAFKNCCIISSDHIKQRYTLLPISTKNGELDITPYDPMANITSYESVKIKTKTQTEWSKVTVVPDRISFIHEDKIYSYNRLSHEIDVYDINNGKKLNTYNWNSKYQHIGASIKGMCASNDYIYIANGIEGFSSPSFIDKIDLESGKQERVCEISADIAKLEHDGSNLFTWENNSDNIYKINPSTGKYTIKQEPTDHNVGGILTMDNGYVYGCPYSYGSYWLSEEICRYKIGDKTSELLSKDGEYDHFLKVKGEWLFHDKDKGNAIFVYKTKLDSKNPSKLETKFLGCIKPSNDESWFRESNLHIYGGYYYYCVTYNGQTTIYRTPEK